jgi:hypothetical protein
MAGVSEKVVTHVETLEPDTVLNRVNDVEKLDRIARRSYGLDVDQRSSVSTVNFSILANHNTVELNQRSPEGDCGKVV